MLQFFKDIFLGVKSEIGILYQQYFSIIRMMLIAAFIFTVINFLDYQRNYFFNQEVFDLNRVPSGYVVWIYPKDKTLSPIMPDSLKTTLKIDDQKLNYNVDIWVVGIQTFDDQIVKIEVPDYAINNFRLGKIFRSKD